VSQHTEYSILAMKSPFSDDSAGTGAKESITGAADALVIDTSSLSIVKTLSLYFHDFSALPNIQY
jgi:hypothetical protein